MKQLSKRAKIYIGMIVGGVLLFLASLMSESKFALFLFMVSPIISMIGIVLLVKGIKNDKIKSSVDVVTDNISSAFNSGLRKMNEKSNEGSFYNKGDVPSFISDSLSKLGIQTAKTTEYKGYRRVFDKVFEESFLKYSYQDVRLYGQVSYEQLADNIKDYVRFEKGAC